MNLVALALSCFLAMACAGGSSKSQATDAAEGGEDDRVPTNVLTAAPTTVEVPLTDDVLQRLEGRLENDSLDVARLVLRDLRPRSAQTLKGVRIFIEKPDADAGTPVDDPHYAGNFVLGLEASQTMLWNVAPTLSRLRRLGALDLGELKARRALRITFVPEPWDFATGLAEDFALPFASLTLEVPPDDQRHPPP